MNTVERKSPKASDQSELQRIVALPEAYRSSTKNRSRNGSTPVTGKGIHLLEMPPETVMIQLPEDGCQTLLSFAFEAGDVLKNNGVFRVGMTAVTIHAKTGAIVDMTPGRLRTYLQLFATTYILSKNTDDDEVERVVSTMSLDCAEGTLTSDAFILQLYPIKGINPVQMPVIRANGAMQLLPVGYDEESGIFTCESGIVYDEMNMFEAGLILSDLFKDFPFTDWKEDGSSYSKAVAVSGMLSLFGAQLLPHDAGRLHFCYTTNCRGLGKTLLAQLAIVPIMGECRIKPLAKHKAEASNNSPYVLFDDITSDDLSALEAILMESAWTAGSAQSPQTVFITGNNPDLRSKLRRPALSSDLYVEEADISKLPHFQRVLDATFLRRPEVRQLILSALWAIVTAWDKAGRPRCSQVVRGCEAWSHVYGSMVEQAGLGCPLDLVVQNNDKDYADMLAVVSSLVERAERIYSNARWTEIHLAEIVEIANSIAVFDNYLEGSEDLDVLGAPHFILQHEAEIAFSRMLSMKFGGCIFTLPDERRVRFGQKSKRYGKRFALEILS